MLKVIIFINYNFEYFNVCFQNKKKIHSIILYIIYVIYLTICQNTVFLEFIGMYLYLCSYMVGIYYLLTKVYKRYSCIILWVYLTKVKNLNKYVYFETLDI